MARGARPPGPAAPPGAPPAPAGAPPPAIPGPPGAGPAPGPAGPAAPAANRARLAGTGRLRRLAGPRRWRLSAHSRGHSQLVGDLENLVDPLADLRLGQRAEEAVDKLTADNSDHHRDRLHLEGRAQLRIRVDVYLGQHPVACRLVGQPFEQGAELLTWLAPLGPQVDDHWHGLRPADDVGVDRLLSGLEDEAGLAPGPVGPLTR